MDRADHSSLPIDAEPVTLAGLLVRAESGSLIETAGWATLQKRSMSGAAAEIRSCDRLAAALAGSCLSGKQNWR
jgi:hypothetical protein